MMDDIIYHLASAQAWHAAQATGQYQGDAAALRDGFLHFSTASQIVESAARHQAGRPDLILLAADTAQLGAALRWEASRHGMLFPHLYGALPLAAVCWAVALPLDAQGMHLFPDFVTGLFAGQ